MIDLGHYVSTPTGRLVISMILGVGLAAVFKEYMFGPGRIRLVTTTDAVDEHTIYKWNGIYYKVAKEPVACASAGEGMRIKPIISLDSPAPVIASSPAR